MLRWNLDISSRAKKIWHATVQYFKRNDNVLLVLAILAAAVGFIMVYSAALNIPGRHVLTQAAAIALGLICMFILSTLDYETIAAMWKVIAVVAITLLLITLILGKARDSGGNTSERAWIRLFGMSFQPSEIVKIAFIITFAKHIDLVKDNISHPRNVALLTLHAAVPMGFILLQDDFGMLLVFFVIFVSMMFAANVKLRYFFGAGIALFTAIPIVWIKFGDKLSRQTGRILALFNPNAYPSQAFQQTQSRAAIGSGEIWGYGLFHGPKTQAYWKSGALPEKQNDLIFAVIGEELGFVGCVLIMLLLVCLIMRILYIARNSKDMLGSMICVGIFSCLAFQIVASIGTALFLFPVVGLTLPFMSSGGTSILSAFLAIGLALSVGKKEETTLFS